MAKKARKSYSEDIKRKVVEAIHNGMTHAEVAKKFKVGLHSIPQWLNKTRTGSASSLEALVKKLAKLDKEREQVKQAIKNALDARD